MRQMAAPLHITERYVIGKVTRRVGSLLEYENVPVSFYTLSSHRAFKRTKFNVASTVPICNIPESKSVQEFTTGTP